MKKSIVTILLAFCMFLPACDLPSALGGTTTDTSSTETSSSNGEEEGGENTPGTGEGNDGENSPGTGEGNGGENSPGTGGGNGGGNIPATGGGNVESGGLVEAYKGGQVTVTFYHTLTKNIERALADYLLEFNKLYPNIKVEFIKPTSNSNELGDMVYTELATGEGPTIALCYPEHVAQYKKINAVMPLDEYIEEKGKVTRADDTTEIMGLTEEQKVDFYDVFYEEGKIYGDDKTYTLPFYKSTEVMYYNKTKFDELGLTVPTTWNEMETVCAALKEADPDCIPLSYDSEANWFITMTEQLGSGYTSATGEHFLFDNAENHAFVEMLRGWYDKGYFTTKEIYGNYAYSLFTAAENKQRCYMSVGSTASVAYYAVSDSFEVAVAKIPQTSTDMEKHKVSMQGPSVCLFNKSNAQEVAAAWLLMKHFTTSAQIQGLFSMINGYTPVIKSAVENASFQEWIATLDNLTGTGRNAALHQMVVQQSIAQMDNYFISPVFDDSAVARDEVGILLQKCLVHRIPADKTVAEFIQEEFAQSVATLKSKDNQ